MSEYELVELPRHCCKTPNLANTAREQDKRAIAVEKAQQRNGGHGRICTLFPVYTFLFDWSTRQQNSTWG